MATVKHTLTLGEREIKTKPIIARDRDPSETQRPLGPVHARNETEYAQSGPCGRGTTIETVTVICGNNPEGCTFHAPRGKAEISSIMEQRTSVLSRFFSVG
jgi:hypothetical protein